MGGNRTSVGRTAILVVATLPFLYPFFFLVSTAFKPLADFNNDEIGLPAQPHDGEPAKRLVDRRPRAPRCVHSLIAVGVAVIVTVLLASTGAFWFVRHQGRISGTLRWLLIGTMAVPPPVFIIPLFIQLSDWNLTDNLLALGFVYAAWNVSFGLYLMYAFLTSLPAEVTEAAEVDGASAWQLLTRVMLPSRDRRSRRSRC